MFDLASVVNPTRATYTEPVRDGGSLRDPSRAAAALLVFSRVTRFIASCSGPAGLLARLRDSSRAAAALLAFSRVTTQLCAISFEAGIQPTFAFRTQMSDAPPAAYSRCLGRVWGQKH